jgi:uncharacterized OB-fold protein
MTMQKDQRNAELLFINYTVDLDVRYDAGPYMGRFLKGFIDKKIYANKCPKCGRICAPARAFCGRCLGVEMTDWVELGNEGILESLEICYYDFVQSGTGEIQKAPWGRGLFKMDGGGYMEHRIWPPDPSQHKMGDRYKVMWNENRVGDFHDILHFVKK